MANGNGIRIPGFFVAGGFGLSNTAILVGGLALVTVAWLSMNRRPELAMDDESMAQQVEADMFAFAASPQQLHENRDRIREALNRIRDKYREAREAWQKKQRDLHIALRNKTITMAQYQAQRRAAQIEFMAAVRTRHREIMELLHIPHRAHDHVVTPTLG